MPSSVNLNHTWCPRPAQSLSELGHRLRPPTQKQKTPIKQGPQIIKKIK